MTTFIIKKQVVRVEKLVGERNKFRQTAFKKKLRLDDRKRFEEKEKRLEDRKDQTEKQVSSKIPVARMGILDVVKNFIFKTLLGAFVIKLLPHLPKLKGVLSVGLKVTDFLVSFSGTILNSLVTFVDKVYQIVDFGKQQAKLLGGDKGLQVYNKALGIANTVLNSMLIAGMLYSDLAERDADYSVGQQATEFVKDRVLQQAGQRAAQQAAVRGAAQFSARAAAGTVAGVGLLSSALGEGAFQLRKFTSKIQKDADTAYSEAQNDKNPFMRFIKSTFYGAIVRPGLMFTNFLLGGLGTLLDVVGAPFRYAVELINYGVMFLTDDAEGMKRQRENLGKFDARIREQIRETVNTLSFGTIAKDKGSFGSLFGSEATKAMGYASGGQVTRGGETVGGTIGRTVKSEKVSRTIDIPTSPLIPGIDAGGLSPYKGDPTLKNIDAFFPNPKDPKYINVNQLIVKSYGSVSSVPFLSPLLEVSLKILSGDVPSTGDYTAIGFSLNNFINTILDKTIAPGTKTSLSEQAGNVDISTWAKKAAEESIASSAQSIISDLESQFNLKRAHGEDSAVSPSAQKGPTAGDNPLSQFGGQAQFVIGDSIAHGFAGRSGNGNETSDTQVGRSAANVLKILKSKGDALKGMLVDLSTGIANSTDDFSSVEEQLSYLKSVGARVRVLGVGNEFSKTKGGINEKLSQLASKYGFYFYGGYPGGKDKVHGTDEDYKNLKLKRDKETAATVDVIPQGNVDVEKLKQLARGAGFKESEVPIMVAIALAESGGNSKAHNPKPPDNSYGLWQINMIGGLGPDRRSRYGLSSNEELFDPATNARVAKRIRDEQGLAAWTTYTGGKYKKFLSMSSKEYGGYVNKTEYVLTHPGEYVIDADSVTLFGKNFYDIINQTETITQRRSASEKLTQILSQYTEDGYPETEDDYTYYMPQQDSINIIPPEVIMIGGSSGGGFGSGSEDPSKDGLYA